MMYFDADRIMEVLNNPAGYTEKFPNARIIWRMLQAMYKRQTSLEKETERTLVDNGMGFNSVDSNFLSSVAKESLKRWTLTPAQSRVVAKCLKKYIKQLVEIANEHQEQQAPMPKKKKNPKQLELNV